MAGIYIPGMEMPQNCYFDCPLFEQMPSDEDHESFNYCVLENWREACTPTPLTVEEAKKGRQPWCPLIPVPPHGRLVDADVLFDRMEFEIKHFVPTDEFSRGVLSGYRSAARASRYASTIIPASEEGEG